MTDKSNTQAALLSALIAWHEGQACHARYAANAGTAVKHEEPRKGMLFKQAEFHDKTVATLRAILAAQTTPEPVAQADDACRAEPSDWVPSSGYDGDGSVAGMAARSAREPVAQAEGVDPLRAEITSAWNDLPDTLRCHPGLKRLHRALMKVSSSPSPVALQGRDERDLFEATMQAKHPTWLFDRDPVLVYFHERARLAWEAWQAARASLPADHGVAELEAEVAREKTRFTNLSLDIHRVLNWEKPLNDFEEVKELQAFIDAQAPLPAGGVVGEGWRFVKLTQRAYRTKRGGIYGSDLPVRAGETPLFEIIDEATTQPSETQGRRQMRELGRLEGIEAAASWVDKRREAFDSEHGSVDPETGLCEFGRGPGGEAKREYSAELGEIEEGIRALAGIPASPQDGGQQA